MKLGVKRVLVTLELLNYVPFHEFCEENTWALKYWGGVLPLGMFIVLKTFK